jgi:hypothetical protein
MKCTTCGYETQPGAKFCVQCGTTIVASSAPAGMAPLAAPSGTPRPLSAPAGPSAVPAASMAATAARPAYTPPPAPPPVAAAAGAASPPVAPAKSMRLGLVAGVLALFAVIGIGSFVAYKMLFPAVPKDSVTTIDANKAADNAPVQAPADAPKDGAAAAGATAAGSPDNKMSSPPSPTAVPAPDNAATAAASPPDASKAAAMPKAADAKAKTGTPGKGDTPQAPNTPAAAPTPSPTRQAAAPVMAPAAQTDRWEQMRLAYEACNKESLFDRLACNSRVGQQYCKGYWGTVPQCPAGAYGDRGNN